MKSILSGDWPSVHVKYNPDTILPKTPVIILCNRETFPNNEFNCRLEKRYCSPCLIKKIYTKKPDSIAAVLLTMSFNNSENMLLADKVKCNQCIDKLTEMFTFN